MPAGRTGNGAGGLAVAGGTRHLPCGPENAEETAEFADALNTCQQSFHHILAPRPTGITLAELHWGQFTMI